MTAMAGAIVAPALPGMDVYFAGHPDVLVKLILTMPALMITLFGSTIGHLADRYGRQRVLLLCLLLYGVAGFSGYLIDSLSLLLTSRAALGIAVAGILSVSTTLIGDYFPAEERPRLLGLQSAFMGIGGVLFLNLGGALADWSWRGPFLVYFAGIILLPYAWFGLSTAKPVTVTTSQAAAAPVAINRGLVWLAYLMGLLCMLLFYLVPAQLPFLLTERAQSSSLAIGLALSTLPTTSALASLAYNRIKPHISITMLYVASFLAVAVGFMVIGLAGGYAGMTLGAAISGLGFGLILPNTTTWLMNATPEQARARIFGGFSSAFFLGQFLSPIAVAPLAIWLDSLQDVYLAAAGFCGTIAVFLTALRFGARRGLIGWPSKHPHL